ncbi:MAG: preprotein translocase subunit YajC [Moorella sp. (in: firmicutes)]|nr:preprotein translocase subunit YajC [Moorella sp. (in: firmicutes)]
MQQWAVTIFYLLIFMGILYFLMIRPQQKQQKQRQAMLAGLKVDDRVVLAGGLHGRITKIKDNTLMVRIADKVEVEVDKAGVAYVPGQEG